jgi:hypothetical protein
VARARPRLTTPAASGSHAPGQVAVRAAAPTLILHTLGHVPTRVRTLDRPSRTTGPALLDRFPTLLDTISNLETYRTS